MGTLRSILDTAGSQSEARTLAHEFYCWVLGRTQPRAPAAVAGYNPGLLSDMAGPHSDAPAATRTRPSPTQIPPSAATEVGCVALPPATVGTARGRFREMQKRAQAAEESGSRVWARPRAACHLTPSQWRARRTGATPHLAPRNKRASLRAKSRGYEDATTALLSAVQSGIRHRARARGPIQTAAGVCEIGDATSDGR
jgi:hypothetical protein